MKNDFFLKDTAANPFKVSQLNLWKTDDNRDRKIGFT